MTKDLNSHLDELQQKIFDQTLEAYGSEVYERWRNPAYMGRMEGPHGSSRLTGSCGDTVEIYLKVEDQRISKAMFFSDGCGPSVVCGSVACELALGKDLEDAASVTGQDILEVLKGLPEDKKHCAFLAARALEEAVHDYLAQKP
ncbi:iron-sulfur cluster assembly scaffold protein [Desulfonatronovibrio hydrogenovorans]|uniref:iron-sulfur cluster assembly scaffold protein n=1 Tax=Desulfonatronovibrio hydrogenovorans TaxID=53245 RepID=UPI00048CA613|nr:iron-sulfur cluster scaffold-like protein [Desulfonatronovibrio hydrogenovorans]